MKTLTGKVENRSVRSNLSILTNQAFYASRIIVRVKKDIGRLDAVVAEIEVAIALSYGRACRCREESRDFVLIVNTVDAVLLFYIERAKGCFQEVAFKMFCILCDRYLIGTCAIIGVYDNSFVGWHNRDFFHYCIWETIFQDSHYLICLNVGRAEIDVVAWCDESAPLATRKFAGCFGAFFAKHAAVKVCAATALLLADGEDITSDVQLAGGNGVS